MPEGRSAAPSPAASPAAQCSQQLRPPLPLGRCDPPVLGYSLGPQVLGYSLGPPVLRVLPGPQCSGSSLGPPVLGYSLGPPVLGYSLGPPSARVLPGPPVGSPWPPSARVLPFGPPAVIHTGGCRACCPRRLQEGHPERRGESEKSMLKVSSSTCPSSPVARQPALALQGSSGRAGHTPPVQPWLAAPCPSCSCSQGGASQPWPSGGS